MKWKICIVTLALISLLMLSGCGTKFPEHKKACIEVGGEWIPKCFIEGYKGCMGDYCKCPEGMVLSAGFCIDKNKCDTKDGVLTCP